MLRRPLCLVVGLVVALMSAPTDARAQTPYEVTVSSGVWSPLSGGAVVQPVAYGAIDAWDEGAVELPLPFEFRFFGVRQTSVWAFTNGFFSFAPPPPNAGILGPPASLPSRTTPVVGFVAPAWQDYDNSLGTAQIRAQTLGSAPNRVFVVQVTGLVSASAFASQVNYQLRLHEGTFEVQVVYGPNSGVANATTALQSGDGLEAVNLLAPSPTCGAGCSCAPAACFSMSWAQGRTISIRLPPRPELTARLSTVPGGAPGTPLEVSVTLNNAGLAAADAFDCRLELSSSGTALTAPILLGSFRADPLPLATAVTATRTVTIPADTPVGRYFVALSLDVDDEVTEQREDNNLAFSGPFATGPELVATVQAPARGGPGEELPVSFTLRSEGAPVAGPVQVAFYFSADATLDAADVAAAPQQVLLPDGFTFDDVVAVPIPAGLAPSPPRYHVIAVVDPAGAVAELDEANNTAVSVGTVEVRGPDLEVSALDGGAFAFRGQRYPLTASVRNAGGGRARDFTVCIVLSDDPLISVLTDRRLLETAPLSLLPGEGQALRLEPEIPVDAVAGTAYVAAVVDCAEAVLEAAEGNNARRRADPVTVRDPAPDFAVRALATSTAAAAGETLPVSLRVANLGTAPGLVAVRLAISANAGVTTADLELTSDLVPVQLAPGTERTLSTWAQLPPSLASGAYFVGAILDPAGAVDEVLETNNIDSAGPLVVRGTDLAIITPRPPPAPAGVPYVRRFSAVGGAEPYVWRLAWSGGAAPEGLSFDDARAELAGTPTREGRYPFTLEVTSGVFSARAELQLLVVPPSLPLTVISSRLPPALAREPYSEQLLAVGGVPPYRWLLRSLTLTGLGLSDDGALGGEPQLPGAYTLPVEVVDSIGTRVEALLALDVVDPTISVGITTANLPDGQVGLPYQTAFLARGGQEPYRWSIDGVVPGLSFDPRTGALTGTPTTAGDYPLIVQAEDQSGVSDRNAYVLEILPEGALTIVTGQSDEAALPEGTLGEPYLAEDGSPVRLVAQPAEGVRWSVVGGELPPGLSLEASSGALTGTPSQAGVFPMIVLAVDAARDVRRAALVIVVREPGSDPGARPREGCGCRAAGGDAARGADVLWGALALGAWWLRRRRRPAHLPRAALALRPPAA
jgi:MYXO-CTERM domain-containing protein